MYAWPGEWEPCELIAGRIEALTLLVALELRRTSGSR